MHQAEVELGCKFIFQRCDPNVFVTLALVLLYPCQLYPDGAAIFPPHDKNKTWSFFLVGNTLRPSFIFNTWHGGTGSIFGAASDLPVGSFVLGTSKYFSLEKFFTGLKDSFSEVLFQDSKLMASLSLSLELRLSRCS